MNGERAPDSATRRSRRGIGRRHLCGGVGRAVARRGRGSVVLVGHARAPRDDMINNLIRRASLRQASSAPWVPEMLAQAAGSRIRDSMPRPPAAIQTRSGSLDAARSAVGDQR